MRSLKHYAEESQSPSERETQRLQEHLGFESLRKGRHDVSVGTWRHIKSVDYL
jgi:hypothetical protein